jgi:hypothetical protein
VHGSDTEVSPPTEATREATRAEETDMMGSNIEDLQADIEAGVADLVAGEGWQRWLAVAAKFPRYSFRNQLLILAQRPDARVVMGYRAWQALGHQVRRGEASISIFAPCTYKTKTKQGNSGELEVDAPADDRADSDRDAEGGPAKSRRVLRGFRVAHVFDIAQTDGDGVQPPERPQLLDGEAPAGLWDRLATQIGKAGFTLIRSEIANGANGVTNFDHRTVTVAPHLSPAQAAKTLAHELAHTAMHNGSEYVAGCRGQTEIEAESVAYIICQAAGLTTSQYSFGYVAHWAGGDPKAIRHTADRVVTTARAILDGTGLLEPQTAWIPEVVAA